MSRYKHDVVWGGRGLQTLSERVASFSDGCAPDVAERIHQALVQELSQLSLYFDERTAACRKAYRDLGMDAEREVATLVEVSQALRARASGGQE